MDPNYPRKLEDKAILAQGVKLYQAIAGSVLYPTQFARCDICSAVNQLHEASQR